MMIKEKQNGNEKGARKMRTFKVTAWTHSGGQRIHSVMVQATNRKMAIAEALKIRDWSDCYLKAVRLG